MLKNVLKEINDSTIYSIANISRQLNISEEMVEELVGQLIRMGYLVEDLGSTTCESTCSGCSFSSLCNKTKIKTMGITEKGKILLKM